MLLAVLGTLAAAILAVYILITITCPWIKYDFQYFRVIIKVVKALKRKLQNRELPIDVFEKQVRERPQNTFIIYQDNVYTYEFVDQRANQIARVGLKLGLKPGDVAALMMYNEPAFVWTYLGLHKIGVSVSLINYHLRQKSLIHCITSCKPKLLIVGQGEELLAALKDVKNEINDIRVFVNDTEVSSPGIESLCQWTDSESTDKVDSKHRADVTVSDVATFIFTSGTTGLPKPAIVNQRKTISGQVAYYSFNFNQDDILYETLPLYHASGLNLGLMPVIEAGAVMVLRSKFSASNFWDDCRKHNVTVIHYIGEMCRYLVNRPKRPEDGVHSIRVAVGNGLRRDIWTEFQSRFRIPQVVEFYGATESPFASLNVFNKMGAVGRHSPLTRLLIPAVFVEFDHNTQSVKRDANGRCIQVGRNQVGLLICALDKERTFEGYYNRPTDSAKKLLHDVFKPGDVYFNTGDLFSLDDEYFIYFHDRTGDTFRWKGENVSTNEVSNVLSTVNFIHDANVYGVSIPGCEGRAGMAAIHLKEGATLDPKGLEDIKTQCEDQLPAYARPKFLRVQRQMSLTSTFKQQKVDLVTESYDPHKVDEPLYYYDNTTKHYEPISESVFEEIAAGNVTV